MILESNPDVITYNGKIYCPICFKEGKKYELKGSRQFLCPKHYEEFRKEREKERIRIQRRGYDVVKMSDGTYSKVKVTKASEYNTKLGTSNFGPSITKDKNGNYDFYKEAESVKKEIDRIKRKKTIGDIANDLAGGGDNHLPEAREEMIEKGGLAFNENESGFICYDHEGQRLEEDKIGIKDEYEEVFTVQDFNKKPTKYERTRKDVYSDWKY